MADQVTVSGLAKAPWPPAHLPQIVTAYQPKSLILERVKGIEPSYSAWKAAALPLSYTRIVTDPLSRHAGRLNRHARLGAAAWGRVSRVAKGADCKSAGLRLRRFESYLSHQPSRLRRFGWQAS